MQRESNHPVHILNTNGEFSRSSFIPFCSFGDELIGSEVNGFDMKVCNIFKPKLYFDQLCFETNLQELKDSNKVNLMKQLELGLTLVLDYNEDRQINSLNIKNGPISKTKFSYNLDNDNSLSLYLDTISIILLRSSLFKSLFLDYFGTTHRLFFTYCYYFHIFYSTIVEGVAISVCLSIQS